MLDDLLRPMTARMEDVRDLQRRTQLARRRANRRSRLQHERIAVLEARLDYFGLVLAAVLQELETQGSLTRERLQQVMGELDGSDGQHDGRYDPSSAPTNAPEQGLAQSFGHATPRSPGGTSEDSIAPVVRRRRRRR
ncbi:hypothetical protein [Planctomycetes bacterium Pla163]